MPRRVIYIKNPKEGSNFRTIEGGGSAPRAPRAPRGQTNTTPPRYNPNGTPYIPPPGNWLTQPAGTWNWQTRQYEVWHNPITYNPYAGMDFGTPSPTSQNFQAQTNWNLLTVDEFYAERFSNADNLFTLLFDVLRGVDPKTGQALPLPGTPGTISLAGQWDFTEGGLLSDYSNYTPGVQHPQYVGGVPGVPIFYRDDPVYDAYVESGGQMDPHSTPFTTEKQIRESPVSGKTEINKIVIKWTGK